MFCLARNSFGEPEIAGIFPQGGRAICRRRAGRGHTSQPAAATHPEVIARQLGKPVNTFQNTKDLFVIPFPTAFLFGYESVDASCSSEWTRRILLNRERSIAKKPALLFTFFDRKQISKCVSQCYLGGQRVRRNKKIRELIHGRIR